MIFQGGKIGSLVAGVAGVVVSALLAILASIVPVGWGLEVNTDSDSEADGLRYAQSSYDGVRRRGPSPGPTVEQIGGQTDGRTDVCWLLSRWGLCQSLSLCP